MEVIEFENLTYIHRERYIHILTYKQEAERRLNKYVGIFFLLIILLIILLSLILNLLFSRIYAEGFFAFAIVLIYPVTRVFQGYFKDKLMTDPDNVQVNVKFEVGVRSRNNIGSTNETQFQEILSTSTLINENDPISAIGCLFAKMEYWKKIYSAICSDSLEIKDLVEISQNIDEAVSDKSGFGVLISESGKLYPYASSRERKLIENEEINFSSDIGSSLVNFKNYYQNEKLEAIFDVGKPVIKTKLGLLMDTETLSNYFSWRRTSKRHNIGPFNVR